MTNKLTTLLFCLPLLSGALLSLSGCVSEGPHSVWVQEVCMKR